ncbi:MAG: hypothetical protein IJ409_00540, partial [Lachnospiraceae bacterium]|nr:hypothetical protein [Lachnospiraceae bacterium]
MKVKVYVLFIMVCVLMLTGCREAGSVNDRQKTPVSMLYGLEVWSFAENELHAYHLRWPHDYYALSKEEGGRGMLLDLEDAKERSEITAEEYTYFVEYVNHLQEEPRQEDSVLSYRIILNYYDENGEKQYKGVIGYDTFPEGWEEFVEKCNEISGGNYLAAGDSVQEVTPEFLTEVFGVTDDDVRGGTLQDVIDVQGLDMFDVTGLFRMSSELEAFYASTKEEQVAPFRPKQIEEAESTQEEYDAFVEAYIRGLESGWEEVESDQDYLRYFRNKELNRYFYIGRSTDLKNMSLMEPSVQGETYGIMLDAHMEGMTFGMNFVYSKDKKFVLLYDWNDPDLILPFVG